MTHRWMTLAAVGLMLSVCAPSHAASASDPGPSQAQSVRKHKPSSKRAKAPAHKDLGEGRKEREQRLLRECKGRPNAGACEGYAS